MIMKTIAEALSALREGKTTSRALLESAHERANTAQALNALAWVDWEKAGREADALDAKARAGGPLGPLHGIPISIKDLIQVAGMPTRGGTRAALHELGAEEASLVRRLREAGALVTRMTTGFEVQGEEWNQACPTLMAERQILQDAVRIGCIHGGCFAQAAAALGFLALQ